MLPHCAPPVRRSRVEPHLPPRPGLRAMPRQRRRHPPGNATSLPPRHHPAHRHGRNPLPGHSRHPETPTLERIYRCRCLFSPTQTKNIVISTGAVHCLIVSSVAEKPASLPIRFPAHTVACLCRCLFFPTQPKTNVISTEATDGLTVRCAVERSLYFVFVLALVSTYAQAFPLGLPEGTPLYSL